MIAIWVGRERCKGAPPLYPARTFIYSTFDYSIHAYVFIYRLVEFSLSYLAFFREIDSVGKWKIKWKWKWEWEWKRDFVFKWLVERRVRDDIWIFRVLYWLD